MSDVRFTRINRELSTIMAEKKDTEIHIVVDDKDIAHWTAYIDGPDKTPYEGHSFKVDIKFPEQYPFQPPKMKMETKIFHPNINESGEICVDILKGQWSPALNILKTLQSLRSLLDEPNPDDPLNPEAGRLCREDKEGFTKQARKDTAKYGLPLVATMKASATVKFEKK